MKAPPNTPVFQIPDKGVHYWEKWHQKDLVSDFLTISSLFICLRNISQMGSSVIERLKAMTGAGELAKRLLEYLEILTDSFQRQCLLPPDYGIPPFGKVSTLVLTSFLEDGNAIPELRSLSLVQ